ncbi:aldehyde dehydrogenase family protein [Frankia sp. AgB32]|uniref:aldehyde dehydrogenase family protein n=1 Tax=Frankia sp. AgB32 TaxID=631119 RepID=UPI00200F53DF|nr:aldehyde dehydrogenase family protein [Frankia sp. AgB32]
MFVEERLYIGGKLREAASGRTYENVNPATEEVIGVAADGSAEDILAAIDAARTAFDEGSWASDPVFRARCLRQLHAALTKHADGVRAAIRAEVGATAMGLATAQFDGALTNLTFAADLAESFEYVRDLGVGESMGMQSRRWQHREPAGVVACITPWNAPLQVNLAKAAFALAAGCTVVLKPAPDTPWSGTLLGALAATETDLPAGVFNVVTTTDNTVAQILAEDPRVDVVSFTGSTGVGRHLMAVAAATVKRVFLELGGKSAWIVCDDADLDANAMMVAYQALAQSGQGCSINTRILVQRPVYDQFLEKLTETYRGMKVGDPADSDNYMGPLINARQRERVLDYIEIGKNEGARLLIGGGRPADLPRGYYVEPTIFADVDPDSRIAQEEIFGPVVVIIPFDTDDEAVAIANSTIFGLAGSVASASSERAHAIARRIRSGVVNVNGGSYYSSEVPFGGYKQSGIGREMGTLGFEEYTEVKIISEGAS